VPTPRTERKRRGWGKKSAPSTGNLPAKVGLWEKNSKKKEAARGKKIVLRPQTGVAPRKSQEFFKEKKEKERRNSPLGKGEKDSCILKRRRFCEGGKKDDQTKRKREACGNHYYDQKELLSRMRKRPRLKGEQTRGGRA